MKLKAEENDMIFESEHLNFTSFQKKTQHE